MQLRPLGLGELFDRAVTLCVRHFWTLALTYLVFVVPLMALQLYGFQDQSAFWSEFGKVLVARSGGKPPDAAELSQLFARQPPLNGFTWAWFAAIFLVRPLAYAALIVVAARAYLGGTVSFGEAYRNAARSWLPLLGISILYILAFMAVYIAVFIAAISLVFAIAVLAKLSSLLAVILGVLLAIAFALGFVAFILVGWLALNLSYFDCVIEHVPVFTAFTRGLQRAFAAPNFRRSLGVSLALGAVFIGIYLVAAAGAATLYGLLHSSLAGNVFSALLELASAGFLATFFTLYYYDLRVRREGYDLHVEMAMPAVDPPGA